MEKDPEETLEQEKRGHKIVTAKIFLNSESEFAAAERNTRENKQRFFQSQNQNWPLRIGQV